MGIVLAISVAFLAWWIVSICYLPRIFKRYTPWRRRARNKSGKLIVKIAFITYILGGICNTAVKTANGYRMPVMEYGVYSGKNLPNDATKCKEEHDFLHTCIHKETRLVFLADIYLFRSIGYILSIGDLLLVAGTLLMTLQRIWIFLPRKKPLK